MKEDSEARWGAQVGWAVGAMGLRGVAVTALGLEWAADASLLARAGGGSTEADVAVAAVAARYTRAEWALSALYEAELAAAVLAAAIQVPRPAPHGLRPSSKVLRPREGWSYLR